MFPPFIATVPRQFSSGQLYATLFAPTAAERGRLPTIRNISTSCNNVGAGLTLTQYGIWDGTSGALLASTADFSATVIVAELLKPLVTPLAMPSTPFYVGLLVVGTTGPQFAATTTMGSVGGNMGHSPYPGIIQAGLAALPDPLVLSASAASLLWFGITP
jgi:hypothetical protein